jgi:hypothetical protein
MVAKTLPSAKTLLTELKLTLADQFTRNKIAKSSVAAKIEAPNNLQQGDASISNTVTLTLTPIAKVVYIQAWANFKVRLTQNAVTIELPCTGLFLHYGAIDSLEVVGNDATVVRLQYIYS